MRVRFIHGAGSERNNKKSRLVLYRSGSRFRLPCLAQATAYIWASEFDQIDPYRTTTLGPKIAVLFATGHKQAQGPNDVPPDDVVCVVIILSGMNIDLPDPPTL